MFPASVMGTLLANADRVTVPAAVPPRAYLHQRWNVGCPNMLQLHAEIKVADHDADTDARDAASRAARCCRHLRSRWPAARRSQGRRPSRSWDVPAWHLLDRVRSSHPGLAVSIAARQAT